MDWLSKHYQQQSTYDELVGEGGVPRLAAAPLFDYLGTLDSNELLARRQAADAAILAMGITFTVYSEAGNIDRAWPFDIIPRVMSRREWVRIEEGL